MDRAAEMAFTILAVELPRQKQWIEFALKNNEELNKMCADQHKEITRLRSSVHELEETVSSLESERNALNIHNAKLLAACEAMVKWFEAGFSIDTLSEWDTYRNAKEATKPQGAG